MEARAEYLGPVERPRLTVVKDWGHTYSPLPHDIMRDTSLSRDARLLYAILQGYWWQERVCFASHATLAGEMGCSTRMLRKYLDELIAAGKITEDLLGRRRSKSYSPVSIGTTVPIETVNENPVSDSNGVNRNFPTVQSELSDTSNRNHSSDSYKKTPEKKNLEEELPTTLVGAASAAEPATDGVKAKKSRGTRCPDTFPLEDKHFAYGLTLGFDEARTRTETDKFLAHHRFKGTVGQDWYAGWQNWMRRAVTYDAPRQPVRNGSDPKPPSRDVIAGWQGFKGRYGSNLDRQGQGDGR